MTDHFSFDFTSNYQSNGSTSKEKLNGSFSKEKLNGSNSEKKLSGSGSKEKLFETAGSFKQPSLTHIISVSNINLITREIQTE